MVSIKDLSRRLFISSLAFHALAGSLASSWCKMIATELRRSLSPHSLSGVLGGRRERACSGHASVLNKCCACLADHARAVGGTGDSRTGLTYSHLSSFADQLQNLKTSMSIPVSFLVAWVFHQDE
jgi:hypothetical protein